MKLTKDIRDKQFIVYLKAQGIESFTYYPSGELSVRETAIVAFTFFATLLLSMGTSFIYSITHFDFPNDSLFAFFYYFSLILGSVLVSGFCMGFSDKAFESFNDSAQRFETNGWSASISRILEGGTPWWRIQEGIKRAVKRKNKNISEELKQKSKQKQLQDTSIDQADQFLTAVLLAPVVSPVEHNPKLISELQKAAEAEVEALNHKDKR